MRGLRLSLKPVRWCGSSREGVRAYPPDARREIGHQIQRIQEARMPSDWKPFPAIGPGVIEIRVHDVLEYRIIVVTRFHEAIHVLHAFVKRTAKTALRDVDLARRRYRALLKEQQQS